MRVTRCDSGCVVCGVWCVVGGGWWVVGGGWWVVGGGWWVCVVHIVGYSTLRTRTALGSYGMARPMGIGHTLWVVCVLTFE